MYKFFFNLKFCFFFSYKRDENYDCFNLKCEIFEWFCFRNVKGKIEYKRVIIVVFYVYLWCVWVNGVKRFKMGVFGLRVSKGRILMLSFVFFNKKNYCFILG